MHSLPDRELTEHARDELTALRGGIDAIEGSLVDFTKPGATGSDSSSGAQALAAYAHACAIAARAQVLCADLYEIASSRSVSKSDLNQALARASQALSTD